MAATDYKDYYNILGVNKSASDAEIKSAFRKLARQYHPDMNPGDSAAEAKFKEVNEAYEVLSDSSKRHKYDQFGQYWNQVGGARSTGVGNDAFGQYGSFYDFINELLGRSAGSSGFPGNPNYSYQASTGPSGVGFDNMSGFGSMGNNATVNTDINADINLAFEEALNGVQKRLKIGSHETITVRIPPGAKPGSRIRVRGKGKPNPITQARGDLYLSVKLEPHPFFQFEGDRILCTLPITPDEAVLGAQVDVPTLEGTVKMNIPAGIKSGQSLRLRSKGWPLTKGGRTDLFVQVQIVVPQDLSEVERECYERIATQRNFNPRAHIQGL